MRIIYAPEDWDSETSQLKPGAIKIEDLDQLGCSVNRISYVTREGLIRKITSREEKYNFVFVGAVSANCGQIRTLDNKGHRCFLICPKPTKRDRSHSEVFFAAQLNTYVEKIKVRIMLLKLLSKVQPLECYLS